MLNSTKKSHVKLTKCPDKVVLWPQSQHSQVKVDDLDIKRCRSDKVIIYGVFHWEQLVQGQIDDQAESTGAQLGHDSILGRDGETKKKNKKYKRINKMKQIDYTSLHRTNLRRRFAPSVRVRSA